MRRAKPSGQLTATSLWFGQRVESLVRAASGRLIAADASGSMSGLADSRSRPNREDDAMGQDRMI
jgi:hypothetical protein